VADASVLPSAGALNTGLTIIAVALHTGDAILGRVSQRGERMGQEELAKTLKRLGPVNDETRDALEALVGALVRKFNHDPIMFLKRGSMSQEGNSPRISITRRIFNLDKTGCPYSSEEN